LARLNCTPDGLKPSRTTRPDPTTRNFVLKETTMNTKHIIAAAAIALTGAGAFAADAAVFEIPTGSTLTRAEAASRVLGRTVIFNEATTFVDATPVDERAMRVLARSFK
jgi:hypothetical protein